ncbi:MAG: ATP-binding protein [Candidatus Micrarchaeota archaeon]
MNEHAWKIIESRNFWRRGPETGVPRDVTEEILKYMNRPEVLYLYGPRRAGKTTVCMQLIKHLSKKYGRTSSVYINFEEPAFSSMLSNEFLEWIAEKYASVFSRKPRFVFFDEIQNVPAWEKFVRGVVDRREFKIIVTGSSAKLLSSEFSTSLGGRGFGFRVLPFSFMEFKKALKKATLSNYLKTGGYPAVVLEKDREKQDRQLEEYFETAITRDIAIRHEVRDVPTLRTLAVYVLTNSGKMFSYNKLRALTGLSFDAIKTYLSYLEEAFVVFQVPFFSYSLKKALEKPRKYYAYDTGLQGVLSKSFSPDLGRRLENAVAVELVRRNKEIQYYSNKTEVDFVIKEGLNLSALNVCASEKIPKREKSGLEAFAREFKVENVLLLNGEKRVSKWLLGE